MPFLFGLENHLNFECRLTSLFHHDNNGKRHRKPFYNICFSFYIRIDNFFSNWLNIYVEISENTYACSHIVYKSNLLLSTVKNWMEKHNNKAIQKETKCHGNDITWTLVTRNLYQSFVFFILFPENEHSLCDSHFMRKSRNDHVTFILRTINNWRQCMHSK